MSTRISFLDYIYSNFVVGKIVGFLFLLSFAKNLEYKNQINEIHGTGDVPTLAYGI